jgi:hypothetical protein
VLWAAILVIGYRGVMAIVLNEAPASTSAVAPAATGGTSQFPVTLAEAYVLQFGQAYLNFDPGNSQQRQQALAAFLPASLASAQPQMGWNQLGTMQLQSESVAGIDVRDAQSAVVNVLATVNGRLMEFGVPVYAANGGMAISGLPSLLPVPQPAQPPQSQQPQGDPVATNQMQPQLSAFFTAYAASDTTTMNRYVLPGVSLTGLGGTVKFVNIPQGGLYVPPGGATREITVTVNWQLTGQAGAFGTTYDMSVVDQQSGKWYVREIRASTQPMGTAP